MPGIGTITAAEMFSEQIEPKGRTTDPANAEPGEYWVRVDQTGSDPQVVAELRRQDTSGVTAIPLFADSEESNLGSEMVRGPSVVLNDGSVGFIAQTTDSLAKLGSPRVVTAAGAEYLSHNALTLPAIPDSQVLRTNDNSSDSRTNDAGIVINPNVDLDGIKAEISSDTSGAKTAYIRDSSDTVLGQTDITGLTSGDTFRVDGVTMSKGSDYYLTLDAGGQSWTMGFNGSPSYPYTTNAFDIPARWENQNGSDTDAIQAVNNIRNLDY